MNEVLNPSARAFSSSMIDISTAIHGFLTTQGLRAHGVSHAAITTACRDGQIERIRNGWYAVPDADPALIRAVRIGGRATAGTALVSSRIWAMPDERLHVAVAPNAARLRCPDNPHLPWDPANHPEIVVHWNRYPWPEVPGSPVVSLHTALANIIRSSPHDGAMTSVDSALNFRLDAHPIFTKTDLGGVLAELPRKYARVAIDADGRAQSGLETLARLRLKRLEIRVRLQVRVKGVGRVDVLVGDRLVLELDSREHHLGRQYHEDRRRDLELIDQGFLVLRVSYERVMFEWDSIERVVLAVVRRHDHLRTASRRRRELARTLPQRIRAQTQGRG